MKFFLIIAILFPGYALYGQVTRDISGIKQQLNLSENNVYVFCRGTRSKSGLIAHQFNNADTNITHVGVGFLVNKKIRIYNVTDNQGVANALHVDSIESFISSNDVYYFSVWKCNNTPEELRKIKQACEKQATKKVFFDARFNIRNDDTLYCSEFCAKMFNATALNKFSFMPRQLPLNNGFYESVLERKNLVYFPVDFFETNENFRKLFEYKFKD